MREKEKMKKRDMEKATLRLRKRAKWQSGTDCGAKGQRSAAFATRLIINDLRKRGDNEGKEEKGAGREREKERERERKTHHLLPFPPSLSFALKLRLVRKSRTHDSLLKAVGVWRGGSGGVGEAEGKCCKGEKDDIRFASQQTPSCLLFSLISPQRVRLRTHLLRCSSVRLIAHH